MTVFTRAASDTAPAVDVSSWRYTRQHMKKIWVDGSSGGTPMTAVALNVDEASLDDLNFLPLSPINFGAVGDGVTDDTAAIRNMINSKIPKQAAGIIPVAIDLGPFTYLLTSTITITQMAVSWHGQGVGNPANYTTAPGTGSAFRWGGPAGIAMFNMVDCWHQLFEGIYFQGNTTNRPSDFIYSVGGGSIGTNAYMTIRKCKFGSIPWSSPTTPAGTMCADYAIRYGPTNANNDRMFLYDVDIEDVTTGLYLPDTQSVWGSSINATFTNCTAGINTASNHTMINCNFQGCTTDLTMSSTADVTAVGWGSENSQQICNSSGQGGSLTVTGGVWLVQHTMTNGRLIDWQNMGDATSLSLTGVTVNRTQGITPDPKLYVRRNSGGSYGQLSVDNCPGLQTITQFDVLGASGGIHANIHSLGLITEQTLLAGDTLAVVSSSTGLLAARFYVLTTGEESSPRTNLTHQNGVAVSQTLYLSYFTAQKTESITQITTTVGSTAAAATQTLSRIGIYSEAANGDLTLLVSTANDTALWRTAYTDYTKAFSSTLSKVAGTVYAVGLLIVTAAALPNWIGLNAPQVGIIGAKLSARPRIVGSFVSQTDLPSTVANGNIGQSTQPCYAVLLP